MKKSAQPDPPPGLSPEAADWWRKIVSTWKFDDAGLLILENGLSAFDRMRQAQAVIAKEGVTILDRFEQPKQHPATQVERDAKATLLRSLKALNLDIEPLNDRPGRPSGKRGFDAD